MAAQEAPYPNNPSGIPVPDNNLINGKNNFDCSLEREPARRVGCNSNAGISTFNFTSGKVHRLRLINAGGEALQRFTIDNHNITIVANGKTIPKLAQLTDGGFADTTCVKTSYPSNPISHQTTWSPWALVSVPTFSLRQTGHPQMLSSCAQTSAPSVSTTTRLIPRTRH